MNSFTRYVLRQLVVGMILVTGVLTCIIWLSQSLRFVEMIVNQGVTITTFVYLTVLLLPNFLTIILPIAIFCIVLFVYSKLISDRELVVMRAAGQNQWALAKPALMLSAIVVLMGFILNLYLLPSSYKTFRDLQWEIRKFSHILLKEGAFTNIAGVTVYVRERSSDGQLLGILAYDRRNSDKPETWMAAKGALVETDAGARVVMFDGNRQTVDKQTNKLSILYFDQGILDLKELGGGNSGNGVNVRHREARERTLGELLGAKESEYTSKRDVGKFIVEGHKRLASPFSALGFTLIGLAFLVAGSFSRQAQSRQIIISVTIVVGLLLSAIGLENMVAKNLSFIPLIYIHSILPIFIAGYVLLRTPKYRIPSPLSATDNGS
jgi:lipopolysaccharide export system permease protein